MTQWAPGRFSVPDPNPPLALENDPAGDQPLLGHTAEITTQQLAISSISRLARILVISGAAVAPPELPPDQALNKDYGPPPATQTQRSTSIGWLNVLQLPGSIDLPNLSHRAIQYAPPVEWPYGRQELRRYLADLSPPPPYWDPPWPRKGAQYVPSTEQPQRLSGGRWLLDLSTPVVDAPLRKLAPTFPEQAIFAGGRNLGRWLLDIYPAQDNQADITALIAARHGVHVQSVERPFSVGAGLAVGDDVANPPPPELALPWPHRGAHFAPPTEIAKSVADERWLTQDYFVPGVPADITSLIGARRGVSVCSVERSAAYSSGFAQGDDIPNPQPPEAPVFRRPGPTFVWPVEESARTRRVVDARQMFAIDFPGPEATPAVLRAMQHELHFDPPFTFFRGINPRLLTIGADVANQLIEFIVSQRPARRPEFVPAGEQLQRYTSPTWNIQFAPFGFALDNVMVGAARGGACYSQLRTVSYSTGMAVGQDQPNPPVGGNEALPETLYRRTWDFVPPAPEMAQKCCDARIQWLFAPDFEVVGGLDSQPYLPHTKQYDAVGRAGGLRIALALDFVLPPAEADISVLIGGRRATRLDSIERAFQSAAAMPVSGDVTNPPAPVDDLVRATIKRTQRFATLDPPFVKRVEFPRTLIGAPDHEFIGGVGAAWDFIRAQDFFGRLHIETLLGAPVVVAEEPLLRRPRTPFFAPQPDLPIAYGRDFRVTQLDLPVPAGPVTYPFQRKKDKFVAFVETFVEHGFSDGWAIVIDAMGPGRIPCYRRVWLLGRLEVHELDTEPAASASQSRLTLETNLGAMDVKLVGGLRIIELPELYL